MNALVFGASAGLGRSLCRVLAARGENLTMVSRDMRDLEAEGAHCRAVYGVEVDCLAIDAADSRKVSTLLTAYLSRSDRCFHTLLFPVGGAIEDDLVQSSVGAIECTFNTNLLSVMTAVSVLLPRMATDGDRTIVGFGSIAAIRGRNSNVAYAAAKRGLESYFESLRHDLSTAAVNVQFYRLGYIATQQSFGRRLLIPGISPEIVAATVVGDLERHFGSRSLPRFWILAAIALRLLPWSLFRQLRF
jgi:short-subunit dehydrogenase